MKSTICPSCSASLTTTELTGPSAGQLLNICTTCGWESVPYSASTTYPSTIASSIRVTVGSTRILFDYIPPDVLSAIRRDITKYGFSDGTVTYDETLYHWEYLLTE